MWRHNVNITAQVLTVAEISGNTQCTTLTFRCGTIEQQSKGSPKLLLITVFVKDAQNYNGDPSITCGEDTLPTTIRGLMMEEEPVGVILWGR